MAAHDTDPDSTLPSRPAETANEEGSVESLLADLSRAPMPVDGVRQTDGHMAASAAVAPHSPPRATESTMASDVPAVVLNTTQPLPFVLAGVSPRGAPPRGASGAHDTILDSPVQRPRAMNSQTTTPSARVRGTRRTWLASVALVAVAAGIAVPLILLTRPSSRGATNVTMSASTVQVPTATATPAPPAAPATITATTTTAAPRVEPAPSTADVRALAVKSPPPVTTSAPPASAPASPRPAPASPAASLPSSSGDFPWRQ